MQFGLIGKCPGIEIKRSVRQLLGYYTAQLTAAAPPGSTGAVFKIRSLKSGELRPGSGCPAGSFRRFGDIFLLELFPAPTGLNVTLQIDIGSNLLTTLPTNHHLLTTNGNHGEEALLILIVLTHYKFYIGGCTHVTS